MCRASSSSYGVNHGRTEELRQRRCGGGERGEDLIHGGAEGVDRADAVQIHGGSQGGGSGEEIHPPRVRGAAGTSVN